MEEKERCKTHPKSPFWRGCVLFQGGEGGVEALAAMFLGLKNYAPSTPAGACSPSRACSTSSQGIFSGGRALGPFPLTCDPFTLPQVPNTSSHWPLQG